MNLFDRIFRRKVSSKNLDAAPQLGEPPRPIASAPVSFNVRVEEHQAVQETLTTAIASIPVGPYGGPLALLPDLPQDGGKVIVTKRESSDWLGLPNIGIALGALSPTNVNLPIFPEQSVRELALLRITIALREVLTKRLFQDLASSKLEIARLCGETIERMRIESPAKLALKYGCSAIASAHARTRKSFTESLMPLDASFSLKLLRIASNASISNFIVTW